MAFAKLLRATGLAAAGVLFLLALNAASTGNGDTFPAVGLLLAAICIAVIAMTIYTVIEGQARTMASVLDSAASYSPRPDRTPRRA